MEFIPSLELSRMLYEERVEPIIEDRFPGLQYAAATLGMCSEVLGLDDEVSMDHEWGPRLMIFLPERDHTRYSADIMAALQDALPTEFTPTLMSSRVRQGAPPPPVAFRPACQC